MLYFNWTLAHLRQIVLYLYSFVYSLAVDSFVDSETYRRDIVSVSDYSLFIAKFAGLNTVCTAPLFLRLGTR
jgi:hypothetical protein